MSFSKKGDVSLSSFDEIVFSKIRKKIRSSFVLNRTEQLKLFAFPDSVLEPAFKQFSWERDKGKKIGYGFFLNICIDLCKKQGMKPDWNYFYRLCKEYDVDPKTRSGKTIPVEGRSPSAAPVSVSVSNSVSAEIRKVIPPPTIPELWDRRKVIQDMIETAKKQHNVYTEFAIGAMMEEIKDIENEVSDLLSRGDLSREDLSCGDVSQ